MSESKLKVLVVEDSKFFIKALRHKLRVFKEVEPVFVESYKNAQAAISAAGDGAFFIALLDLCLPDAGNGEIIELTHAQQIPSIILSSSSTRERLDYYYSRGAIDCISKDNTASLDYLISLLRRLLLNRHLTVMVVEDTLISRKILVAHLSRQFLTVIEAEDGREALEMLDQQGDINMILTDYNMPHIDGFELTRRVRKSYPKNKLPIIGVTGLGRDDFAVQFLKLGANDFIHKPFSYEELLCRVSQNLEITVLINELRQSAYRDALTGLYNRRHLFEFGEALYQDSPAKKAATILAMIDIDYFKKINDNYGHQVGDEILIEISNAFTGYVTKQDMVARFGGEEFCIILKNTDVEKAIERLETLRLSIADQAFLVDGEKVHVSISIGMCRALHDSFDDTMQAADQALYEAKRQGRNCLRLDQETQD
ncbi:diguanylate cyclase [Paremcibacter congregatus]|uniref:GGDEF domain-containing response regulator n=1 Tax=Paremcibacter congregatus TaxID=2043170 RepID=UPI003A909C8E